MTEIRRKVRKYLGSPIPKQGWSDSLKKLDIQGKFDNRAVRDMLAIILEEVDNMQETKKK